MVLSQTDATCLELASESDPDRHFTEDYSIPSFLIR
jgi:hypothetical protein